MIPFVDLKAQYLSIKKEIDEAVSRVLMNSSFILGPEVAQFEEGFARRCGVAECVGVNSGTSALHLALLAAGVGPGDEVITVPFTFVATAAAIRYTGAKPVFVDIDPKSFTMNANLIEAVITAKTKAIIPVHLYGQPADMDPIIDIARKRGMVIIEDAAQAHLAEYKGRLAGSMGDLGCFSFYPGKNLGAYGEGGAVVTNNAEYARTIRMLRDWGQQQKGYHELLGYNYRMEGIQGAILRVKLRYLDAWTDARRKHAAQYNGLLAGSAVKTPEEMPYAKHVYHVYAIRAAQRDQLQKKLVSREIHAGVHYQLPVHLQRAFSNMGYREGDFPQSEKAAKEVLSLPIYAELTEAQIETTTTMLKNSIGV